MFRRGGGLLVYWRTYSSEIERPVQLGCTSLAHQQMDEAHDPGPPLAPMYPSSLAQRKDLYRTRSDPLMIDTRPADYVWEPVLAWSYR
jgi:hypothetical protein